MQQILNIIDKCKILRLGLFDKDYPYVVPLLYGYEYADSRLVFYMHSAKEGHRLALIADNPLVCVELDGDAELISGGEVPCMSSPSSVQGRNTIPMCPSLPVRSSVLGTLFFSNKAI